MKPTQVIELFANIKKTFVSFFSILMFVALGVGIFLGISWVSPALQNASESVFDQGSFHNFQIQFPYGLADEDLKELENVEGVTDVEAGYTSYQTLTIGDKKRMMKLQSMFENIDTLILLDGQLPTKPDEIALNEEAAKDLGIAIGDTIVFDEDQGDGDDSFSLSSLNADQNADSQPADTDGMKYLNGATYKVVALVHSPEYLAVSKETWGYSPSPSGAVDVVGWVPTAAFDPSAFQNGFPLVNVRCDSLGGINSFSDDYKKKSADIEARITALGDELAERRYDDLHGQAQSTIDEYDKQLADAKAQIEDGERQIEEGREKLESERAAGEAKLAAAYQELCEYQAMKDQADWEIAEARAYYADAQQKLETMKDNDKITIDARTIEIYGQTINIEKQTFTGKELREKLPEIEGAISEAEGVYYAKVQELNEGWAQYYAGWDELNARVAEAEQELAYYEQQIEDGKQRVADGEPKLAKAKEQLAEMKDYSWTVTNRASNAGAVNITVFSDVTTNLSFSMAALFVIVGLLVSYSAVSRIVHEQVTQIGTKKALGLYATEITLSFLAYSALAVIAGAVVGTIVGYTLVEGIIANALSDMFILGNYPPYFGAPLFLIVTALELTLVLGATWLACRSILRQHAVELLRGEKPPEGKTRFYEKWGIWEKLPLLTQTIVNNCVNDKRRVFSTVVGVAGCTALIVTAITLNNDVLKSYDVHYADVYGFSDIAYVDNTVENAADNVESAFKNDGSTTAQALFKSAALKQTDDSAAAVRMVVPADEEAFAQVYHVNPVEGSSFDPNAEGVWMSQAYAEHFNTKVGDKIKVDIGDGVVHELEILGFYEFRLTYHEIVMGSTFYEKEFGAEAVPNAVLASQPNSSIDEMIATLAKVDGFDSASDDKEYQSHNFTEFASVSSAVVLIYMALSALMAIVVLLNLNVMFINEKKRELIVLMINGFSVKDAKRYIYNDSIVLTAIGIILGIVLGCIMGSITVGAIEPSTASFIKDVDWIAVLAGVVGSALLAIIMSIIALRRIPKFELTDINRF